MDIRNTNLKNVLLSSELEGFPMLLRQSLKKHRHKHAAITSEAIGVTKCRTIRFITI